MGSGLLLRCKRQEFFVDRTIFYSTYTIQEQAPKGDWLFELRAVYTISILDFTFDSKSKDFLHRVKLMDVRDQKVFYDKLTFIYLEMPKFLKSEDELETDFDRWLYLLKNMALFEELPIRFQQKLFKSFFQEAAVLNLSPTDLKTYQSSLKSLRDFKAVLSSATKEGHKDGFEEGLEKGVKQAKKKIADELLKEGLGEDLIEKITRIKL
jgi:predicted transposase/invertase (TIGR01784 family)